MTRHTALAVLLLATASAPALAENCRHSAPRSLDLDFGGVRTVMFDVGPHTLRIDASPTPTGRVEGRACASDEGRLDALTLDSRRDGDKLVVRLAHDSNWSGLSLGNRYAYMILDASVPADVLVQLQVGSGDARVTGASAASTDVGSGDVEVLRTSGRVTAKVGSGDVEVDDAGALHVLSIGSGDLEAANVRGEVEVGSIGSGDFTLRGAGGDVAIRSIGSGDAELADVTGSVSLGSVGSGDLDAHRVGGDLRVDSIGSGDVDHSDVAGRVELPRKR
ncbi:DUF4097 family beta strand repeat-containing protein [Luteimonas kalidii]|uniref:DUF4097 domain-containing protein n=1 Tax=Luteimonas kalidii TaxID=3042025 RepID=A0ABT6JSZ2_9GAMM|nr:DUF4097 family beta strand repeat-containing protein [Luteimonas kalidii]MDH5833800.1 hypothetical protein [Luteimonas kalidii]